MPSNLALKIKESFPAIPYCNQQAYDILLASGEKLVFDDLEAIAEILIQSSKVAVYHRELEHQIKTGNRSFILPVLSCLSENCREKFERKFNRVWDLRNKVDYGELQVEMTLEEAATKQPTLIYLDCEVIQLVAENLGREASQKYANYVRAGSANNSQVPPEDIDPFKKIKELVSKEHSYERIHQDIFPKLVTQHQEKRGSIVIPENNYLVQDLFQDVDRLIVWIGQELVPERSASYHRGLFKRALSTAGK